MEDFGLRAHYWGPGIQSLGFRAFRFEFRIECLGFYIWVYGFGVFRFLGLQVCRSADFRV